ncbi:MAG: hypothetical protein IT443_02845 [Phycisphaeraceae bacterium]|nr:hypothetical protein [Phycisphaeraceae bacterium]
MSSKQTQKKPKVSVIMVDGSFREAFHAIDFFGRQNMPREDYELIWVEYFDKVNPEIARRVAAHPNFRIICLGLPDPYHSSYCFNRGILEAKADLIVIPDGDIVVEEDFLARVYQDHQQSERLVEYFHRHNEPEDQHREPVDLEHLRKVCTITNPANHGGCLSVRKKWLLEINGYDQHPIFSTGFHANDKDVYARLNNLGLLVRWSPDVKLFHPWHVTTSAWSPHYAPQTQLIHYRGISQLTRAFRGIDPSTDYDPPARFTEGIEYALSTQLSLSRRALRKIKRACSRLISGGNAAVSSNAKVIGPASTTNAAVNSAQKKAA